MQSYLVKRSLVIITLSLLVFSACSTSNPKPEPDRSKADLMILKGQQREYADRFAALESSITNLNSRIEKLEFYQVSRKNDITAQREIQREVSSPALLGAPIRNQAPDPSLATRSANTSAVVPMNLLQQDRSNSNLADALSNIQANRFAIASDILLELKSAGVGSDSLPLILFWEGICKEAVFDNKSAIASFSELTQQYPSHERSGVAMLRQASVFTRIGEKELARLTLEKITKDYPNTQSAEKAYRKLRDL